MCLRVRVGTAGDGDGDGSAGAFGVWGWTCVGRIADALCHIAAVTRLQWRPQLGRTTSPALLAAENDDGTLSLASSSFDASVRLFRVRL